MITGFENITDDLTKDEKTLLYYLCKGFERHKKDDPIKGPAICTAINTKKYVPTKLTEARLRKLCNYIRVHSLLPLVATSKGYYISYDVEEIQQQIQSLEERSQAILGAANGLKKFIN